MDGIDPSLEQFFDAKANGIAEAQALQIRVLETARREAIEEIKTLWVASGMSRAQADQTFADSPDVLQTVVDAGVRAGWVHCTTVNEIAIKQKRQDIFQQGYDQARRDDSDGY